MVFGAPDRLTKVSFRRDVRFFLGTLVGFLVVLILVLLILLQNAVLETEITILEQRKVTADAVASIINRLETSNEENLRSTLAVLRDRFDAATVSITTPQGRTIRAGYEGPGLETETRSTHAGRLTISFDTSPIRWLRRRFFLTAAITVLAVIAGTLLLLFYAPKITRPIERLLDEVAVVEKQDPAVDEQEYLIETFRKTIATLRVQEQELRRLHDEEKTRADDFERVAAALTRSLSSGFIAIDPQGQIVDLNQSGREILRLPSGDPFIGRPMTELPAPEGFVIVLRDAVATQRALTRHEIQTTTAAGERVVIGLSTVPLQNEQGDFLGMVALFTDLTPIRDMETRMRDMQTLADLGEMSAGIAHEFRNSLSTILGYLKLAGRQADADAIREKIRKAEEEASLLSAAITSLLNFTRPMTLEPQSVDLRQLVEGIVDRMQPQVADIEFSIDGDAHIDGDRGLLARAVENILRNAVDAVRSAGGPGLIEIILRSEPPAVIVKDNGTGLAEDTAPRSTFVPFHSAKPGGIGLGLPLAKKIALLHGGTISLSPRPGGGAIATMEFHRRMAPEQAAPAHNLLQ